MLQERVSPVATYRLQLRPEFGFDDAARVLDYLRELGVSHIYFSPLLQAAEGSTHGYDVVDHSKPNVDLGGEAGHARLCEALESRGLGQVLDIVPNHMSIASGRNLWWRSVLESGPASPYATYFDVDWVSSEERHHDRMLMPILADHYGKVLEDGGIQLSRIEGTFVVRASSRDLPVAPLSVPLILELALEERQSDELLFYADALRALPSIHESDPSTLLRRARHIRVTAVLLRRLVEEQPEIGETLDAAVARINADPDLLDQFLEQQNYRLAYWRAARHDLDYRRFFDINELAALRVEDQQVFEDTHRLVLQWVSEGKVEGLRIDHPDGLSDPQAYLERLRQFSSGLWIVVEKILHPGETLPESWPVDGTTGYDFMFHSAALFVDPAAERAFSDLYEAFLGEEVPDFEQQVPAIKRMILTEVFVSDVVRLARNFLAVCADDRRHRDYTLSDLREILVDVLSHFPVYRTYVRAGTPASLRDERWVEQALAATLRAKPDTDPELLAFIKTILLGQHQSPAAALAAARFQQLSGPATAKAVEDTAFYRYNRLVSLNEVGGTPARFGVGSSEFHGFCMWAAQHWPRSMLATSTHDNKRSEDTRMRISLLSQMPEEFSAAVREWSELATKYRRDGAPDRAAEFLVWQTLVGAWPISRERLVGYMIKAAREAKLHTSWLNVRPDYEQGLESFCAQVLQDGDLCARLDQFVQKLNPLAQRASLSLTAIKLTAPGIPDIYQGNELWDYSLTDPDNRRPVDYEQRRRLLAEVKQLSPAEILDRPAEGMPKLYVLWKLLQLRRARPQCFAPNAAYLPLDVHGPGGRHVVAYARNAEVAVIAPTLLANATWNETWVNLPRGTWKQCFTDQEPLNDRVDLSEALRHFPVVVLERISD